MIDLYDYDFDNDNDTMTMTTTMLFLLGFGDGFTDRFGIGIFSDIIWVYIGCID